MDVDTDLEELMGQLGEFGKYQFWQFLMHSLAAFLAGIHMLCLVTVAAVPNHRCVIPGVDFVNGTSLPYDSPLVLDAIPQTAEGKLDSCLRLDSNNDSIKCDSWVYDTTYYQTSLAMEWNFVCNQRWMGSVAQAAYMFGVFMGAVVLGSLADKFGRKTIFYISAIMQLLLGVGVAFAPEYYSLLVLRFIYGVFGSAGAYITGFVLSMELLAPSKRTVCGIAFSALFAIGVMLVALWGFVIKDYVILQAVYGLHALLLVGHWWLMDESPRWLWAQGRVHEAVIIVERGVKRNGRGNDIDVAHYVSRGKARAGGRETRNYSIIDLFRTPNLRNKTLNVCYNWFANSLVYYGLSLNTGALEGNPFLILFLMGLVEIPCYVMTVFLMDRTGRRSLLSTALVIGGFACMVATFIPKETKTGSISSTSVVMVGKFFISTSFAIVYNYTAELFPTVVRNTSVGLASMCARLSGTITPLIMLMDTIDKKVPSMIFAVIAIVAGLLSLLLPETLNNPMPQSLEDGENFGKGDTACASCWGKRGQSDVPLSNTT